MQVGCEVGYCCGDAGVQGAAVGEVAAEAHTGCANAAWGKGLVVGF